MQLNWQNGERERGGMVPSITVGNNEDKWNTFKESLEGKQLSWPKNKTGYASNISYFTLHATAGLVSGAHFISSTTMDRWRQMRALESLWIAQLFVSLILLLSENFHEVIDLYCVNRSVPLGKQIKTHLLVTSTCRNAVPGSFMPPSVCLFKLFWPISLNGRQGRNICPETSLKRFAFNCVCTCECVLMWGQVPSEMGREYWSWPQGSCEVPSVGAGNWT